MALTISRCVYNFPDGSGVKNSLAIRRPRFDPGARKILWTRKCQPTPVILPEKAHGQRDLVGYVQSMGHKALDQLNY